MLNVLETLAVEWWILHRPRLTDAPTVFEEYCHDRSVTEYLMWRPHREIDGLTNCLPEGLEGWERCEELRWGVTERENGENDRVIRMESYSL